METHSAVLDVERGQLTDIRPLYWQTDTSISNKSWGFIEHDSFKSPQAIIHQLIDIVSKNGNLLVNIGPRSDGTIPEEVQNVLREVGEWLKINGEAIYGTRPWKVYGEGPTKIVEGAFHDTDAQPFTEHDFRFTTKNDALYACELGWPSTGQAVIHSLAAAQLGGRKIASVSLLGSTSPIRFDSDSGGLQIHLPAQAPGKYAHCFKIGFDAAHS
jgi:alpha-L-fucosidase